MKTAQSVLFASGAAFAVTAASMPLAAGDITHLRTQIRAMQGKITGLGATEKKTADQVRPDGRELAPGRQLAGEPAFPWRSDSRNLGPLIGPLAWSSNVGVWDGPGIFVFDRPDDGIFDAPRPGWFEYRLTGRIQLILAVDEPRYSVTAGNAGLGQLASLRQSGPSGTRGLATTLRYRWDRVSTSLTGIVRGSEVDGRGPLFDLGLDEPDFGWGLTLSADYRITGRITLGGGVTYVEGLPRYTFGNGLAAIISPAGTAAGFDAGNTVGAFGWVKYRWTSTIRSNAIIGYARQDIAGDLPGTGPFADSGAWTILANVVWNPARRLSFGAEYSRLVRSVFDIPGSGANRFQVGMQYRF